jgi:YD repeat-containing protein
MVTSFNPTYTNDHLGLAIKAASNATSTGLRNLYTYSQTGYANPDAVTQIANGLSTTTFTYDNNGNVTQKTIDGTTTTYGYDAFGQRVIQTGTTTTTLYPFKWYSVASSTGSGAKYATTASYMFNGDTLLATADGERPSRRSNESYYVPRKRFSHHSCISSSPSSNMQRLVMRYPSCRFRKRRLG